MRYMIMNYTPPSDAESPGGDAAVVEDELWSSYTRALQDAGVMVGGNALHPADTATTLRVRDGVREIHDGPYATTKEHLGGYYLIDVPDLDVALEWAARNPAASSGAVEIRPVLLP